MKLIVQILFLNEEKNLSQVLTDILASIPGVGTNKSRVIYDGSTDSTVQIAQIPMLHGQPH